MIIHKKNTQYTSNQSEHSSPDKDYLQTLTASILLNDETLKAAPLKTVKNPPAMQDYRVWSLGWADPLEKGMAIHSSILVWRIPWTEDPAGL